jgi:hypothetical protein
MMPKRGDQDPAFFDQADPSYSHHTAAAFSAPPESNGEAAPRSCRPEYPHC